MSLFDSTSEMQVISMQYKFTELFDIPALTKLCQSFTDINGVVTALLDLEGNVHIATGWQDICTKFHRKNPATAHRCTESDTFLAGQLENGLEYNVYRCKNGLVDVAVPVLVNGEHVANFFTGQFFFEPPDVEYFKEQAAEFGFDQDEYLEALDRAPVYSEETIKINLAFLVQLTEIIGEMGKDKIEKLQANEKLKALASTDSLTGICNRSHFIEETKIYLKLASRNQTQLQLMMIDIDHFKVINDTHGHHAGDLVLKKFSEYVLSILRETDLFGRIGGEEFSLVLQNTDIQGGDFFAEKVRKGLENLEINYLDQNIDLRVSIGIASFSINDTYHTLSRKADLALYRAKETGRNKVSRHCPELPQASD